MYKDDSSRIPVVFYRTRAGRDIVRDWLKSLPEDDRRKVGQDLMRLQYQWPVGMPLCRPLGRGLWELRSDLSDGRIVRIFFCMVESTLVALHGLVKKTQKTPLADLDLALKRKREISAED